MKSVIIFRDGRRASLASAISAELYAELEVIHSPRKDPALFCGGCGGGIYLRHGTARKDELFGAHHEAGECPEAFVARVSAMTDEHKRMAEYHARAAQSAGFSADMEVVTSGRTRVDVVIDGRIGLEVQRSALTARAAIDRTARSLAAGLEVVAWCAPCVSPQWVGKVPGYRFLDNGRHLKEVPARRSVQAAGVWTFRRGWTRREGWRPAPEPVTVLVDDAVARMAAGVLKPVTVGRYVRLVPTAGITLYEEMTGVRLTYDPGHPVRRALPRAAEDPCPRAPLPVPPGPQVTACIWCLQQFDDEAIRFRLTIHPRCADERVKLRVSSAYCR